MNRTSFDTTLQLISKMDAQDFLSVENEQLIVDQASVFAPPRIIAPDQVAEVAKAAIRMIQPYRNTLTSENRQHLVTFRTLIRKVQPQVQEFLELQEEIQQALKAASIFLQHLPGELLKRIALTDPTNRPKLALQSLRLLHNYFLIFLCGFLCVLCGKNRLN